MGYGDSGSVPHSFYLREGQNIDVGILKLFLSRNQVNLSHVSQLSPFQVDSTPTSESSGDTVQTVLVPEPTINLSHHDVAQSSPFQVVSTPTTPRLSVVSSRGTVLTVVSEPTNLPLPWDTVEIPVVQRRAGK